MEQFERFGLSTLTGKRNLTRYYERYLLMRSYRKHPTHFIAISRDVEAFIRKQVPAGAGSVHVLPNAIDLDRFSPTEEKGMSDRVSLVTVGRLDENKNHDFLLRVVEELKTELPGIHLDIIGAGPCKELLQEHVREFGLQQHVSLLGHSREPEQTLRRASIYVHSARKEGFGLAMVEAMACGLPVVALDGGGNRDIVENGINGYLLEEADPLSFAQKIKTLVNNPDSYQQLRKGALQTAQRFGMEEYIDRLVQLYKEARAEADAPQNADN